MQWQYKLFHILPHSPPMGVPVLWQDGPVVQFSHFLVSNVQSKFYRLDLLLVFFLLNSNSNHQQFQSSDSDVVAVCGVTTVAPNCFKHGMSTKRISQSFRPQINRKTIFLTAITCLCQAPKRRYSEKCGLSKKMVSHQLEKVRWLEKLSQRAIFDHSEFLLIKTICREHFG